MTTKIPSLLKIAPNVLQGSIVLPSSKSYSHRYLLGAGLASGKSVLHQLTLSQDIEQTISCIESMGAKVELEPTNQGAARTAYITGTDQLIFDRPCPCRDSATTLRLLLPVAGLLDQEVCFQVSDQLRKRPQGVYQDLFDQMGLYLKQSSQELYQRNQSIVDDPKKQGSLDKKKYPFNHKDHPQKLHSIYVKGPLPAGEYRIPGNQSSQFISGLLFALPCIKKGKSRIILTTPLASEGYVQITRQVLQQFGVTSQIIEEEPYLQFDVKGGQIYQPIQVNIPSDASHMAFWIVAGLLGNGVLIMRAKTSRNQGDFAFIRMVKQMGADLTWQDEDLLVKPSSLYNQAFDLDQTPDLLPPLAALGACSQGVMHLTGLSRNRIKESDRLQAMASQLQRLGIPTNQTEESLLITGKEKLNQGVVDSFGDHRIAMAFAVISQRCQGLLSIKRPDAVNKSYPHFWQDFCQLGGQIDV